MRSESIRPGPVLPRACFALGLLLAAIFTGGVQAAQAQAPLPPSTIGLSADRSVAKPGETILLTATADRTTVGTGYWIYILDDDTGGTVGGCNGASCQAWVTVPWSENKAPKTRHYRAVVRQYGGSQIAASSSQVTVVGESYVFDVTLTSSSTMVKPGESFALTATTNRTTAGTGYYIYVIDDATGATLGACMGSSCEVWVSVPMSENVAPKSRRYHAEVREYGATHVAGRSDQVQVIGVRATFSVDLSFSDRTIASDGKVRYLATASASPTLAGTSYYLRIRNGSNSVIASCLVTSPCSSSGGVPAGTYRATVEDISAREFGASSSWTLSETDPPREDAIDGLDLVGLAALLATDSDPCLKLAGFPGAPDTSPPSTINDYQKACEAWRFEGRPMIQIIRDLAARTPTIAGASVVWWLLLQGATDAPTTPFSPPVPTDPPTSEPKSDGARRAWGKAFTATAATLIGLDTVKYQLDAKQAEVVARKCIEYTARVGQNSEDECRTTPIFASGSDVAEATAHDIVALSVYPPWVRLNRELGSTKPGNGWQNCPGIDTSFQECDEYPFFATEQGGPLARPLPHLMAVDADDNGDQGILYSNFVIRCKLSTGIPQVGGNSVGGAPFLGTPIPPDAGIPTWFGCKAPTP